MALSKRHPRIASPRGRRRRHEEGGARITELQERGAPPDLARQLGANRLPAVLDAVADGIVVQTEDGVSVYANAAAARLLGYPDVAAYLAAEPRSILDRFEIHDQTGRPVVIEDLPGPRVRRGDPEAVMLLRLTDRGTGVQRWCESSAVRLGGMDGEPLHVVHVLRDVTRSHVGHEQAEFLAEASGILGASLEAEDTVRRVARLAVPRIADWCAVEVLDEAGVLRVLALEHADPQRVEHLRALRAKADATGPRKTASARVLATGEPELVASVTRRHVDEAVPAGEIREATTALDLTSYICVPLRGSSGIVGTLTLATEGSARRLGAGDLSFAQVLAARTATALETARLFADAARLRAVVDTVEDLVEMFDPRTLKITYVNDALVRQLGRSREALLRLTPCDLTVGLGPARLRDLLDPLVDGSLTSRTVDTIRRGADGSPIPIEFRWQYVELPGERGRIVALGRDIRERLAQERRLADLAREEHARAAELNAIIRTIGEGLLVVDRDRRIRLANPTAHALFPRQDSRTLDDVVAALSLPPGMTADDLLTAGMQLVVERRDEPGWLEVAAYPVDPGALAGAGETILILRDITAARERERVRDAFVGVLSHELRTPLTTIFGGAKVLARDDGNLTAAARTGIFEDIQSEAERLHRLVEDVVALTRFGEGALEIGHEPVLLQRVIPIVARSEEARWPNGAFELGVEPDLPPVSGDATYVEQVVRNLLANAVKYGQGSAVRIEAAHVDGEVSVRVLDGGPGFPADEADRLFELYYRSPSVERHVSGSGLGLYVCARLIEAMGGRIWAHNRSEGGAEFGFSLRAMGVDADA